MRQIIALDGTQYRISAEVAEKLVDKDWAPIDASERDLVLAWPCTARVLPEGTFYLQLSPEQEAARAAEEAAKTASDAAATDPDNQGAAAVDAQDRLLFEVCFDMENRMRAREGKGAITRAQYRDALIARWKQLNA
jgi:hypothetical protein